MEKYSVEWIQKQLRPLPKNFEREVNNSALSYSRYLFCHRENGVRYGYCTHCHKQGEAGPRNALKRAGEEGYCPHCHSRVVIKDVGRSRKHLVDNGYILFLQKARDGGLVVRAGNVYRDYRKRYEKVSTEYQEQYIVYFNAGVAVAYRRNWYFGTDGWSGRFEKMRGIPAPHPHVDFDGLPVCPVGMVGFTRDKLRGTALWHCEMARVIRGCCGPGGVPPVCKYLAFHAKHAGLAEKLEKEGFFDLIGAAACGEPVYPIYWNAKTVPRALGLTRDDLRGAVAEGNVIRALNWRKYCKKNGITKPEERAWVQANWHAEHIWGDILKHTTVSKIRTYTALRPDTLSDWRDYLDQCDQLGLDLRERAVLFPKDLHAAHQRNTDILNRRAEAERARARKLAKMSVNEAKEKFEKNLPALQKKYNWQNGDYLIRVAEGEDDLLREGSALGHCVGTNRSYKENHFKGLTLILFVRRASDPEKPFFTVEYKEATKTVYQCRGKGNCAPPTGVKDFLDVWRDRKPAKTTTQSNRTEMAA